MTIAPAVGHLLQAEEDAEVITYPNGWSTLWYLGVRNDTSAGPEAFLGQCPPGDGIPSHFHPVDQFQVLYGGEGSYYQRHGLPKTLLHYVDAYSVYGPFGAGENDGMQFFTLRPIASELYGTMPEHRAELLYRGERHYEFDLDPYVAEGVPPKGAVVLDTLIERKDDGLAAHLLRVGPGTPATPPEGELRTGRYTIVVDGALQYDGRSFGPKTVGWSKGETEEITFEGGADGVAVLFLNFPYPSTASVRLAGR